MKGISEMGMLRACAAALLLLFAWSGTAFAAESSPALKTRASDVVALFNGTSEPERLFSPVFLAQVPPAQVKAIAAQMKSSYGAALAIQRIEAKSEVAGTVFVDFERAVARVEMAIAPAPPHLIEGLLIAGVDVKGDSVAAIFGEITALPGDVSLAVARLEDAGPANILTEKAERPLAIGSSFKLFILAELARAVKAGERKWSDVVPLDHQSLPSGLLQDWPKGAPLTLHSLAALMISRSDNSATDTLLHALGRDRVEAILPVLGVQSPERLRPFLSTREAFALKLGDAAALAAWRAADEAGRRARLAAMSGDRDATGLDPARFAGAPAALDVEWLASPADLVRTLDWLRRNGDQTTLDILAINPGLGRAAADQFAYMGFKGGSEPGVLNTSFLLRSREGRWLALSATWNNAAAALDEAKFIGLIGRLIATMK
jgi:beta-lactamase class A